VLEPTLPASVVVAELLLHASNAGALRRENTTMVDRGIMSSLRSTRKHSDYATYRPCCPAAIDLAAAYGYGHEPLPSVGTTKPGGPHSPTIGAKLTGAPYAGLVGWRA
jgi:hypothetical protein